MVQPAISADVSWLFATHALEISPADSPFWYTSGLIGPYYINTHYLCGGSARALELLDVIDAKSREPSSFAASFVAELRNTRQQHDIYRKLLAALCRLAESSFALSEIDYISGGQRRDWFFAPLVAEELRKPCLYLYNDLSIVAESGEAVRCLDGAKVLNVADLLTVGSSYTTKWVPALERVGARLHWSLNVVDRRQGGEEALRMAGLAGCASLFAIDAAFFGCALEQKLISPAQHALVISYLEDPFTSMREFLRRRPDFLERAKNSPEAKTRARAELQISQDLYQLGD